MPSEQRVRAVCASHHTLVITDNAVMTCGPGHVGNKPLHGHGHLESICQLTPLEAFRGVRAATAAAGGGHTLVSDSDGRVWSFGAGQNGQLGHGNKHHQSTPRMIHSLQQVRIVGVAAGFHHSLILSTDGALFSFGRGLKGRLGHGDERDRTTPTAVWSLLGMNVHSIAAGDLHSVVTIADGSVWSFGDGSFGQLGHGDTCVRLLPKLLAELREEQFIAVAAGAHHTLLLTRRGEVQSCGRGDHGQLGHETTFTVLSTPKAIGTLRGKHVLTVKANGDTSMCQTWDESTFCWGEAMAASQASGTAERSLLPQLVRIP